MNSWRSVLAGAALAVCTSTYAQRTEVPLMNFEGIPVAKSGLTTAQVRAAVQAAALASAWDLTEEPAGTLLGTYIKDGGVHTMTVRFKVDDKQISAYYVDSKELRYVAKEPASWRNSGMGATYDAAAKAVVQRYSDRPESPYAVKTEAFVHPSYELWLREFLASVRRHTLAAKP